MGASIDKRIGALTERLESLVRSSEVSSAKNIADMQSVEERVRSIVEEIARVRKESRSSSEELHVKQRRLEEMEAVLRGQCEGNTSSIASLDSQVVLRSEELKDDFNRLRAALQRRLVSVADSLEGVFGQTAL